MYAVVASGGKQYRVSEGQALKLEKLDIEAGQPVEFDQVLMVSDGAENIKIGTPVLEGVKVYGEVLDQGRHKKIDIIKFKRRKHHMKKMGHRQDFTEVLITGVGKPGKKAAKKTSASKATDKKAEKVDAVSKSKVGAAEVESTAEIAKEE